MKRTLADWRAALELDHDELRALHSSPFLLEHEARLAEAPDVWRSIIARERSPRLHRIDDWPKRELKRIGNFQ